MVGFLKRNFKENQGISKKSWKLRNKGNFYKRRNSQTGEFFSKTYNPKTFLKKPKNICLLKA